jgi:hypothetical protein
MTFYVQGGCWGPSFCLPLMGHLDIYTPLASYGKASSCRNTFFNCEDGNRAWKTGHIEERWKQWSQGKRQPCAQAGSETQWWLLSLVPLKASTPLLGPQLAQPSHSVDMLYRYVDFHYVDTPHPQLSYSSGLPPTRCHPWEKQALLSRCNG